MKDYMVIHKTQKFIQKYPGQTIFLSLIITIIVGTFLLWLPWSDNKNIPIIDIFFLATSLTTVTGLKTISLTNFTMVGKYIIIGLMQIGGLGLIIMSFCIMHLLTDIGIYTKKSLFQMTHESSFQEIKKILSFILVFTFACETIGASIIFFIIKNDFNLYESILFSIFHAVSYFCNVGLSLYPEESLAYNTNIIMQTIKSILILLGALGFVTWYEIFHKMKKNHNLKFSWQTTVALKTFSSIIVITTFLFLFVEYSNCLSNMTLSQKIFNSIFVGISSLNCGDLPFLLHYLHPATLLLIVCVGFIGSAPSSTGGGIKTNAFAIFIAVVKSALQGKYQAKISNHVIAKDEIYKSMTLIFIAISWIICSIFILLLCETTTIFDLCIETISAFSNTGFSTGVTPFLSSFGKFIIITTMIIGRIGTFIFATKIKAIDDHD